MKTIRHFVIVLLVLTVTVGVVVGLRYAGRSALDQFTGFDRNLNRQYGSVKPGMPREEVLKRMGQPKREESQFHFPAAYGYEEEYRRAEKSGAVYYLYWESSSSWEPLIYVVGFATNNAVAFKSHGTSDPPKQEKKS